MCPGGSPVIDREDHVLLVSDYLVEVGVVEAVVLILPVGVGGVEVGHDVSLLGNLQHIYDQNIKICYYYNRQSIYTFIS